MSSLIDLKNKYEEFLGLLNGLRSRPDVVANNPELKVEYDALLNRGSTIANYMDKIYGSAAGAFEWVTGFFESSDDNLGALPLIPIAVISGALSIMGKWIADVYVFNSKVNEIKRLENDGINPAQAYTLVNELDKTSLFSGGNLTTLAALGAMAFLFYKGTK